MIKGKENNDKAANGNMAIYISTATNKAGDNCPIEEW